MPRFRNLVMRHLKVAFGSEMSDNEIELIARNTYINYGKNLAEFFMLPTRGKRWIERKVKFCDPDFHIRTALQRGKGVVGLGGHFGSWELVAARIGLYKYPVVIVMKVQRNKAFAELLLETRFKWGNEWILKRGGIKEECLRKLKENKIVALMADQNATRGGVFIDFFGEPAATVTGPAELALRSGAPIIPCFPARNPDDTITLYIYPPLEIRNTGNWEEDIKYNTALCVKAVEKFAREHPTEYFWWHKRWSTKENGRKEL